MNKNATKTVKTHQIIKIQLQTKGFLSILRLYNYNLEST